MSINAAVTTSSSSWFLRSSLGLHAAGISTFLCTWDKKRIFRFLLRSRLSLLIHFCKKQESDLVCLSSRDAKSSWKPTSKRWRVKCECLLSGGWLLIIFSRLAWNTRLSFLHTGDFISWQMEHLVSFPVCIGWIIPLIFRTLNLMVLLESRLS